MVSLWNACDDIWPSEMYSCINCIKYLINESLIVISKLIRFNKTSFLLKLMQFNASLKICLISEDEKILVENKVY